VNSAAFFSLLGPELTLAVGAMIVLLIGVAGDRVRRAASPLAMLTVFAALVIAWYNVPPAHAAELAGIRVTNLAWYIRLVTLSVGLLVLLLHWQLPQAEERGEIFAMILFSLAGILLTAVADDLVVLFLAIELVSVPTYVLVSIGRSDVRAQEAGLKYFFLGALSAALLVYGFSFLYGASGTTTLSRMSLSPPGGYALVGLLLAFAGVSFKIAAVPFHVYVADVYQGAASPVTGLLGFFPKVSGFVALIKLLVIVQPAGPITVGWNLPGTLFMFLWVVSVATMTIGNVLGFMQTNVKRMLAYSSVAHSGYMLIALLVGPVAGRGPLSDGISAMLFYIVAYGVMNLGVFAVLSLVRVDGKPAEELSDLAGLGRRQPAVGLALAICVLSLMGMPPTAGFFGKVYVFMAALSAGPGHPHQVSLIWLAIIGVVNAAVAAGYYLRIIGACYLREHEAPAQALASSRGPRFCLLGCCMVVLLLGVWPQGLMRMSRWPFYDLLPPAVLVNPLPGAQAPAHPDPSRAQSTAGTASRADAGSVETVSPSDLPVTGES
jgi:NADH-quinone oxidoreductase subunit N